MACLRVRIDPRSSLSVQLIHEANFGPERFAPFGPPLTREPDAPLPFRKADEVLLCPPVENKPESTPADTHVCDGRLGPVAAYLHHLNQLPVAPEVVVEVREVETPTTLPTRGAGSLIDVLA